MAKKTLKQKAAWMRNWQLMILTGMKGQLANYTRQTGWGIEYLEKDIDLAIKNCREIGMEYCINKLEEEVKR